MSHAQLPPSSTPEQLFLSLRQCRPEELAELQQKWKALPVEEKWQGLASILPTDLTHNVSRDGKGYQRLKRILADLDAMELEAEERFSRSYREFTMRWNFLLSLFLRPTESEDIIGHLEDVFERDIDDYGETKAKLLYRKNVLVSLGPLAKWIFHRTVIVTILKHCLPRLFM
jgi:hypothetical protein